MKRLIFGIFAVVLFLGIAGSAQAVDSPFVIDNVPNVVGVGVAMVPDYLGSDNYQGAAAPFFRWTFAGQERYLQFMVTELSLNLVNRPDFALGPVLNIRFGRNDDVEDDRVKEMEEIDDTLEVGAFASYIWRDQKNPRHRFIASVEALFDVGDVHNGGVGLANLRYWYPVNKPIDVLIGVGTTFGSSSYMDTYFGVDTKDARKSDLDEFTAGKGFRDWNATTAMVFHFSETWHLGVGVKYFMLVDDAANSPIVEDQGSTDQWVAGFGLAYAW